MRPSRRLIEAARPACDNAAGAPFDFLAGVAAAALLALSATAAPAGGIDLSISAHYSSGDYGEEDKVDVVYVPAILRLESGAWQFKTIVPFLLISGGSTLIDLPTGPVRTENGTSEGLGDVVLEAAYAVLPPWYWSPYVDIAARIKLPTADEDAGLGTGEFDFTPEVEILRRYGRWTPFASVGFRVLGDTRRDTYRDGFLASAGFLYLVLDWLEPGVFLYWRQAATDDSPDSFEILPMLRMSWSENWLIDAYASAGFTDSSPDAGVGIEIRYRFRDTFD